MSTTTISTTISTTEISSGQRLDIRFPQRGQDNVAQDEEWCEVVQGDAVTKVRFHDYAQVFGTPGLYDQLFGGPDSETKCISPRVMAGLLRDNLHHLVQRSESQPARGDHGAGARLRVLDFGAGNGMIGEEIRVISRSYDDDGSLADSTVIVGFDILPEAKLAAERDRPGVYDRYIVADITEYVKTLPSKEGEALDGSPSEKYNVLISISALAFGHASADALRAAASLVEDGGLIAFNLREGFLDLGAGSNGEATNGDSQAKVSERGKSFSQLVREAIDQGQLSILAEKRYCHRLSVTGEPLYYVGVVVQKHSDLG